MSKSSILSPTPILSKKNIYVSWLWEKQANITSVSLQEPGNVIHNMEAMICFLWGFNFSCIKIAKSDSTHENLHLNIS